MGSSIPHIKLLAWFILSAAPLVAADSETAIEGEYIVVLKNEASDHDGKS